MRSGSREFVEPRPELVRFNTARHFQFVRGRLLVLSAGSAIRGVSVLERCLAVRGGFPVCSVPAAQVRKRWLLAALNRDGKRSVEEKSLRYPVQYRLKLRFAFLSVDGNSGQRLEYAVPQGLLLLCRIPVARWH